ncbi:MAG: hypothetical protein ACYTE8_10425 [Planctomycetota bacterium]|jgi:hypothetical protein
MLKKILPHIIAGVVTAAILGFAACAWTLYSGMTEKLRMIPNHEKRILELEKEPWRDVLLPKLSISPEVNRKFDKGPWEEWIEVKSLNVKVETPGDRPVFLSLSSTDTAKKGASIYVRTNHEVAAAKIKLVRGGNTTVAEHRIEVREGITSWGEVRWPPSTISGWDHPPEGEHTYSVYIFLVEETDRSGRASRADQVHFEEVRLCALRI